MTEPTPELEPEPAAMPRWIPILIGAILVLMGALAVYTGMRDREDGLFTTSVKPRSQNGARSVPPGEPGAGASLVTHGSAGDDSTPAAKPAVEGEARAVITGGPEGVQSTVRIWARRGMQLDVTPSESMIYVNDLPIGHARQFDTAEEIYDFPAPGSYTIRVVAPNNAQRTYVVTAADDAKDAVAHIKAKF